MANTSLQTYQPADWGTLKSLRKRFAYLNQDSPIFMWDIKKTLCSDILSPSWHGKIYKKPAGCTGYYQERIRKEYGGVGEMGKGLSGGESKRIAFIRELLRSSEILILDEPLDHLDEYLFQEIELEIVNIKAETIVIIISNQFGFERLADEIREF